MSDPNPTTVARDSGTECAHAGSLDGKVRHPNVPVFIHIEYQIGKNHTMLHGKYDLGKLVSLTEFMVGCIDRLIEAHPQPIQECAKTEPAKEVIDDDVKPTALETKWREFRETIKTETPQDA